MPTENRNGRRRGGTDCLGPSLLAAGQPRAAMVGSAARGADCSLGQLPAGHGLRREIEWPR